MANIKIPLYLFEDIINNNLKYNKNSNNFII